VRAAAIAANTAAMTADNIRQAGTTVEYPPSAQTASTALGDVPTPTDLKVVLGRPSGH
jgi:hypothetical protein